MFWSDRTDGSNETRKEEDEDDDGEDDDDEIDKIPPAERERGEDTQDRETERGGSER